MSEPLRLLLSSFLLMSLLACTATPGWQSDHARDHVLAGSIWRASDDTLVSEQSLLSALAIADYLLLGEKHDNPDHHALRLEVLKKLIAASNVSSVSMEMLDSSQAGSLQSVIANGQTEPQQVRELLDWDESGWDWEPYAPVVQTVLAHRLPLRTANLSSAEVMARYREENTEEPAEQVLDAESIALLREEIRRSHCDMLPASQFPAMVRIQQARDQAMALSLQTGLQEAGMPGASVLLAGNFHIRRDLGVPRYLQHAEPDSKIISVAWLEVSPGVTDPSAYLGSAADTQDYDYIWFTPVSSEEDYCASLQAAADS